MKTLSTVALVALAISLPTVATAKPVRLIVWDERQPAQKKAYANFLGNEIAEYLRSIMKADGQPQFEVTSVAIDDPEQGLPAATLDNCDVLVWWGHIRHGDVKDKLANDIVRRIQAGKLSLIALHSAHWSKPFVNAMFERAVADALKTLPVGQQATTSVVRIPPERRLVRRDEPLTPSFTHTTGDLGIPVLTVKLPMCVFPAYREDGKPSHVRTLLKNHPIARGIPETFDISQTEMYDEPFHVPTPDAVIFEERWDLGEHFRSGCLWNVGKGKVFYFRPGHETFPIYKEPIPLKIVENAARWLGSHTK